MKLDDTTFGGRLKLARKWLGFDQYELSRRSGIPQTTISYYERNITSPSLFAVICLADTLNVSLDWLAGREDKGWIDTHLDRYITLQKNLKK